MLRSHLDLHHSYRPRFEASLCFNWQPGQRVTTYQLNETGQYQWYSGTIVQDNHPEGDVSPMDGTPYTNVNYWNRYKVLWDPSGATAAAAAQPPTNHGMVACFTWLNML